MSLGFALLISESKGHNTWFLKMGFGAFLLYPYTYNHETSHKEPPTPTPMSQGYALLIFG